MSINESAPHSPPRESASVDKSPRNSVQSTAKSHAQLSPSSDDRSVNNDGDLRRQTIDSHLTLFRVGLMVTVAVSVAASIKLSGLLNRVNSVEEIPLWQFARRKKLRVRMIRQSRQDPSVFYVYHTPFFRRLVLQDALPQILTVSVTEKKRKSDLLAVRLFGVHVDESSRNGSGPASSRRIGDFAHELVSHGYAECIPENLENYDNGSESVISYLAQRLKKLEAAQKHAQVMQYGIWKDWQEEKLSDRVLSAGKRATTKGFRKIIDSIRN
ncbi:SNase-like [Phytophthora cactorum]|nr:SNase-like [Phytophthora cactorum]